MLQHGDSTPPTPTTVADDSAQPQFGLFLVAVIDILGQRSALRALSGLRSTTPEPDSRWDDLRNCAASVIALRTTFSKYFQQFTGRPSSDPSPHEADLATMRQFDYNLFMFSDTVIVSVPLGGPVAKAPATAAMSLLATLHSIAVATLVMLLRRTPIRAGLDVGVGISHLLEGEVYGPVTVSAYELESRVADYPRTMVGNGVLSALETFDEMVNAQPKDAAMHHVAQAVRGCREVICQMPGDDRPMLDFLARADLFPDTVSPLQLAAWVREQHDAFRASGNAKLSMRYARLLDYFRQRGYSPGVEGGAP